MTAICYIFTAAEKKLTKAKMTACGYIFAAAKMKLISESKVKGNDRQ
jgi:hypothetical protein